MTPNEWKARHRDEPVAKVVENAVLKALPEESAALGDAKLLAADEKNLKRRPIDSDPAVRWIWHQCACAATWTKEQDPYRLERLSDTEALNGVENIQSKITSLLRAMEEHPKLVQGASAEALLTLREQGIDLKGNDGRSRPVEELFAEALHALHVALNKPVTGLKCGPFMHRSTYGCLTYVNSIEGSRKSMDPDTMLLFAVVLYFRCWTLGIVPQQGQLMPEFGKPSYAAAAEIVTAVFPDTKITTENAAQGRLRDLLEASNKDRKQTADSEEIKTVGSIGLVDWPNDK